MIKFVDKTKSNLVELGSISFGEFFRCKGDIYIIVGKGQFERLLVFKYDTSSTHEMYPYVQVERLNATVTFN